MSTYQLDASAGTGSLCSASATWRAKLLNTWANVTSIYPHLLTETAAGC
jgi:hypothetical protein